jgi:hypothetical protein
MITIIVQNDMVMDFRRTCNKIFAEVVKYKQLHTTDAGTYFEIETEHPETLFYLGINTQIAYELSDARFFKNKFKL